MCRYVVLKVEDLEKLVNKNKEIIAFRSDFNGCIDAFSLENEVDTWAYIKKIVQKALSQFPTSLKEDH